jgi:hypothetical protein
VNEVLALQWYVLIWIYTVKRDRQRPGAEQEKLGGERRRGRRKEVLPAIPYPVKEEGTRRTLPAACSSYLLLIRRRVSIPSLVHPPYNTYPLHPPETRTSAL